MHCPFCKFEKDKVIDSRLSRDGEVIRRRRQCLKCSKRFTTYERIEITPLMVVKKDGRRENFNRQKVLTGLMKACEKRPISYETLEKIVEEVEGGIRQEYDREVSSKEIGERVMQALHRLDQVAYVRFASVYRQFTDINDFLAEAKGLLPQNKK